MSGGKDNNVDGIYLEDGDHVDTVFLVDLPIRGAVVGNF
jgi:hypothetical protein